MKKVKITVLRKTFQEDLAGEYGVEILHHAQCWKLGMFFMLIGQNLKDFVMRLGKQFTNMFLHWLMEQEKNFLLQRLGKNSRCCNLQL